MLLAPTVFRLKAMLIRSEPLLRKASLVPLDQREETYCGADISPMNNYYIRDFHEISLTRLEYTPVTCVQTLFEFSFVEVSC
jgi:hypothetical protein